MTASPTISAPARPAAATTIASDVLGPLTVPPSSVIRFPAGLFGFPECRAFVLVPSARDGIYWLQSADHPSLAFVLVDPFAVTTGFAVDLQPADLAELDAGEASAIAVLAIVTLPRPGERPTANLQGPLALNLAAGLGKQLAAADTGFGLRHEFEIKS